jgi:hypothetical protein
MNNILDQSTITATAIIGSTLAVTTGKLSVAAGGVTSNELAANAVTTTAILDANVTAGKLSADSVITAKILDSNVTAPKLATDSVETAKIKNANVTAAKLDGAQTGDAPIYGARAFGTVITSGTALAASKGNVSGVTKSSTGQYIVSFTNNMPTTEYSVVATTMNNNGGYTFVSIYNKLNSSFSIACGFRDNSGDRSVIDIDVSFVVFA